MVRQNGPRDNPRVLDTVSTTLRIISLLEEKNGAEAVEIAESLDTSLSSVYNHLTTLSHYDFVSKDGGTYELSYQFLTLGEFVRNQSILYQHARDEVDKLCEETGEYAHLTVEQNGLGINLYKVRGRDAVGADFETARKQKPDYLHYSATGKSILAHLPEERVDNILNRHGLPQRTSQTITERDKLLEELEKVEERGFAINDEEEISGIRAVGAPILSKEGDIFGAISVSGPASRLQGEHLEKELPNRVKRSANVIEVNINTATEDSQLPSF